MTIAAIHKTIALAREHEAQTGHLERLLQARLDQGIHLAIRIPERAPARALVDFVLAYIERVPDFLQAAREITAQANIEDYALPILDLAQDYFLKPPEIIAGHIGLDELMDEAYLAHRLMEEVNDRFMVRAGIPLVPMDMTMSNLVVHSLIGEPFANELDDAVHFTVERLMAREHVYRTSAFQRYVQRHRGDQWESERQRWPCLMDQLSIDLQFMNH